ncbi:MAG TPA: methyltransferase domain-containing protein [Thermomicrobiales bacterium]|nr:methyltransferase domain-containing protein [Thermomicrobiales bacterium]
MAHLPKDARNDRDIFRLAPTLDATAIQTITQRLEFRRTDERYVQMSEAYFERLPLDVAERILAVGCGTGIEARALKRRTGTGAEIVGVDHSPALIEAAERLTREEGLAERVRYQVGDAHHLPFPEASFDIVLLHTLLSHVDDPLQALREARRVARPGGTVVVFDGDYASLTWGYPDPALAREIEERFLQAIVANPRVMRDMPRFMGATGLEIVSWTGELYADVGSSGFWLNAVESLGSALARSGLLPPGVVEEWQRYQAQAAQDGTFFGAANFYTYLMRRPQ